VHGVNTRFYNIHFKRK